MKRLLFIFNLMLFITTQLLGGDINNDYPPYEPMVVEGYSWNVVNRKVLPGVPTIVYSTYSEKIEGDSIVNGVKYKKLWKAYDTNLDKKEFLTLIRENYRERKVYAHNNGAEVVLYDFGYYGIGDTIKVIKGLRSLEFINSNNIDDSEDLFVYLVIDNKEQVKINNFNLLDKITYHVLGKDYIKGIFYERFGSENGWYSSPYDEITGGGVNFMICTFDADGNLVFKPEYGDEKIDNIENCYINETINTKISNIDDEQQNVYYNSQEKTLNVNFECDEIITIYDTMGKVVMSTTINADTKSISLNLNAGIYIVTNKNQNIYSKFVVK